MKTSYSNSSSSSRLFVVTLAITGLAITSTISAQTATPLPANTAQMCASNAVGTTCPSGTDLPDIACCASDRTGAFFNACCPSQFTGIQMGASGTNDSNQFTMDMENGLGVVEKANCKVNADGKGCATFEGTGNGNAVPINYPAGVEGPCVEIASGASCSTTQGICTIDSSGSTFPVCCPACATGSYLPGQSCSVTLPDPAACGINVISPSKDNNETDTTADDIDVGAPADADTDADVPTESPTEAPVAVAVAADGVDDGDNGTPSPTFKEGDAPSVSEPSEVVQPIFEAPIAPEPISGATKVKAFATVVVATTIVIAAAAL